MKIELELTETITLYNLLEENQNQTDESLTKLRKTLARIIRSRQFQANYKAEINKIITEVMIWAKEKEEAKP